MKRQLFSLSVSCAALALGAGLAAVPAQAAAAAPVGVAAQSPAATSPTIAGWTSHRVGDGSVKRFVVPTLNCAQAQRQGVGVGVGRQTDVTQPEIIAEVLMLCVDHEPVYLAEVFVDGSGAQSVVSAGDVLRFEISYAAGMATTTVTDLTNPGAGFTLTGAAEPAALHFGSFPYAGSGTLQDVPDFGTVKLAKHRQIHHDYRVTPEG